MAVIPRSRAGRIALALIVANEIRGLMVVGPILWSTSGRLHEVLMKFPALAGH